MTEIKFDIGRNIIETARDSGISGFTARDVAGLVSYKVNDLPLELTATFGRPGLEISLTSLFAFTMYADRDNKNDLAVENVTLQFAHSPFKSHAEGQAFAEQVISKMNAKKWARHINHHCPAVTGRSSVLGVDGELNITSRCGLDPHYKLATAEWIQLMDAGKEYQWKADGVLATLRISYTNDSRGITYSFFMEFDDFAIKTRRDNELQLQELAEGDKQGWKSTEAYKKTVEEIKEQLQILEANAVKRGDRTLPRE